jgi:hypothetical protein
MLLCQFLEHGFPFLTRKRPALYTPHLRKPIIEARVGLGRERVIQEGKCARKARERLPRCKRGLVAKLLGPEGRLDCRIWMKHSFVFAPAQVRKK